MERLSDRLSGAGWRRLWEALQQPRVCWSVWCVVGCVVAALLYLYPPEATGWWPRCPFHSVTGLNCPGCGSLRALHAMLHGRVVEAFCCNPLLVVCLPVVGTCLVVRIFGALALNRSIEVHFPTAVNFAIAGTVLLFFVARNVPAYPFTLLSP